MEPWAWRRLQRLPRQREPAGGGAVAALPERQTAGASITSGSCASTGCTRQTRRQRIL